ncbi:helix-turn-helix domain-containing protein [Konateibacter massiliensis]|uniref:helix-turn-helix domain-containing protein n=1 Tax=Konateibacter massiliensis TaxID=2002841 RepID=UPI000C15FA5F|nr:helix-turn-helix domain-containing protein [Konateibacter massiliensis]
MERFNYKNRILWYLLVVVFTPIIVLGVFSYNTYVTEVTRNVNLSTEATANQVKERMDSVLISIKKSYLEAEETDEIRWLLNTFIDYSDYSELVAAIDVLDGSTWLSEYIEGFSFINFQTGWVLSNRGLYEYENVENKADMEMLYQYGANTLTRNFWVNRVGIDTSLKLSREEVNLNNLSFVCKLPAKSKSPYALMIVNLNQSKIESMISDNLGNNDITVLDGDGNLIYTTNEEIMEYCQANLDKLSGETIQTIKLGNGEEHNVAVADSDDMDWKYIVSYDVNNIKAAADKILSFSIVMGIVVISGVLLIILTRKRIYAPVFTLTNYISDLMDTNKEKKQRNEFKFIADSIDNLVGKNNALEKLMENQQEQLVELFELRLIRSEVKEHRIEPYLNSLKLVRKRFIGVIAVNISSQDVFEEYEETKQDAVRLAVVENLPQEIKKRLFMPAIVNARVITMAVTEDTQELLEEKLLQIYDLISKYVFAEYQISIHLGISKTFEDLFHYQRAYQESLEALKNSEFFQNEQKTARQTDRQFQPDEINGMMFYSDIMNTAKGYVYNIALEKEIREAVDLCDKEAAFAIVDKFVEELVSYKVSSNEASFYMHRFMISIILIASNAGLVINNVFGDGANNIFLSFNQIYDLDKMSRFYKYKVITPIISELGKFRTGRTMEIMESIQELVIQTKGDITLAECAERLNYHPSYIWKIMKSEKNITFSDYIAEYKISEAKRMLTTTTLTVADIAAALNYTNTQNFIRFFSKHVGTTPGKFRQEYDKMLDN